MPAERSPSDLASSSNAKDNAVSKALADIPDNYSTPSQVEEPSAAEPTPATSKEPDAEPSEPSEPVASKSEPERSVEGQPVVKEAPITPSPDAPAIWPKDRREWFSKLSDGDKKAILDMEKNHNVRFTKTTQENAEYRRKTDAIGEVLSPYRNDMQAAGLDEVGAIRYVLQERETFNRDPVGFVANFSQRANGGVPAFIKALIERSGLSQEQLFGRQNAVQQPNEPDPAVWQDPDVVAVRQQNEALQSEIQALKQTFGQFTAQHQQRESLTIQQEIQNFQWATDDLGNPSRPHFETVKPIMQRLMDADPDISKIPDWKIQEKLQAAYDKSVWLVPEIRQQLIDSQVNQSVATQVSQQVVAKAQVAATRKPSPGANGVALRGKMSKDEAIRAAMQGIG